jgi:hypothetical protein
MQWTLDADGSCQKVINGWIVQRAACGLQPGSTRTGGFCRTRGRRRLAINRALA